jgi:indole-3-glycerol phosphate synthase
MSDFLGEMARLSVGRATDLAGEAADLRARAASAPPPLPLDISAAGFDVIAEAKLATPADGVLVDGGVAEVVDLVAGYEDAGAIATSVLTEATRFAGSMGHLEWVVATSGVPAMRKDFLVDPIQVVESRAAGASGILLIARILEAGLLVEMTEEALDLGMFVVIEVFEETDLETASAVFGHEVIVGVNCRDLATLAVDPDRFESILPGLPADRPRMAESGIRTEDDAARVARLGYRLDLVGSALVTDPDPGGALGRLLAGGRSAVVAV